MIYKNPFRGPHEIENELNEKLRHCRIGRVTKKVQVHGGKWVKPPENRSWWERLHVSPDYDPNARMISGGIAPCKTHTI